MDDQTPDSEPPALPPLAAEPTTFVEVGPRRRGRARWLVGFAVVVALLASVLVVASSDDEVDPDAALAQAQDAVADADGYRFELRETTRTQSGDPDGAGSGSTTRSVTRGAVAAKDRWSVVEEFGYDDGADVIPSEYRRIGDRGYLSGGYVDDGLPMGPGWVSMSVHDIPAPTAADLAEEYQSSLEDAADYGEDDSEYQLELLVSAYLLPVQEDPHHVERLISAAEEPTLEEQLADGAVRLRARLRPLPEFAKVAKDPLPTVELLLDLDRDRRPIVVRYDVALKGASQTSEVRFSDWGADLGLAAPADADIDRTPWIEEERIAALDPRLLLAPPGQVDGLDLVRASVYDQSYSDDEPCLTLSLDYAAPQPEDPFGGRDPDEVPEEELDAYYSAIRSATIEVSLPCEDDDDTPFDGVLAGLPARYMGEDDDTGMAPEVRIGDVVVSVSTDLEGTALEQLVRSIAPVTVDQLGARIPAWARSADEGPFGFGGIGMGGPTTFIGM